MQEDCIESVMPGVVRSRTLQQRAAYYQIGYKVSRFKVVNENYVSALQLKLSFLGLQV